MASIIGNGRVEDCETVLGQPGFWRIAQTKNGVWWFLDPDNRRVFLTAVTTVQPIQKSRDKESLYYISKDWNGNKDGKEGDLDHWAKKTIKRVRQVGFKGIGAWSHPVLHKYDVPISRDLNLWRWAGEKRLFYDSKWFEKVEHAVRKQVTPLKHNRNLVGYYTDNELGWNSGFASVDKYFNGLAPDNPNRLKVSRLIQSLWTTVNAFNEAWQTNIEDWRALDGWAKLPKHPTQARNKLIKEWRFQLARDYFRVTSELIRKYDSNHLILGARYKRNVPKEITRASRDHVHAQSVNMYSSNAQPDLKILKSMYSECGRPIIISEYSFHALDGRSGNKNKAGFIWGQVKDQQARAQGYRHFTTRLAQIPYVIGSDWFQWNDEPPAGRYDGEDVNFGVVDIYDRPYSELVNAIKETGVRVDELHENSTRSEEEDISRQCTVEPMR